MFGVQNRSLQPKPRRRNNIACLNDDKEKQLHLVLDLDHTLIHSISVSDLSEKEKYLIEEADSRFDLWILNIGNPNDYIIKLRPFAHEFLRKANKLFTMHVYTMGNYDYAQTVLRWIDPEKIYFGDRVIAREQSPYKKTLDLIAADERRVIIVDDTIHVWHHHQRNLLQITKYSYFSGNGDKKWKSYAQDKSDESRSNGPLANVMKFLKVVHRRFEDVLDSKDLRLLIPHTLQTQCSASNLL